VQGEDFRTYRCDTISVGLCDSVLSCVMPRINSEIFYLLPKAISQIDNDQWIGFHSLVPWTVHITTTSQCLSHIKIIIGTCVQWCPTCRSASALKYNIDTAFCHTDANI
jgi:hypothetical protein